METRLPGQSDYCVSNMSFFKCTFIHEFKNIDHQLKSNDQEEEQDFEDYQKIIEENKALLLYINGKQ